MFGMTKKQFLKKSKKCLKDTGIQLLLIREIFNREGKDQIDFDETYRKLDKIRENMETIFFQYEGLKPPSKCKPIQIKILKTLIILQDALVANLEYLILLKKDLPEEARVERVKSLKKLELFREKFRGSSQKVDLYLR
jgi:hypothetical protein